MNIKILNTATDTIFYPKIENKVGILKIFPGINASFVTNFFKQNDLKGVILETYGSGNALSDEWFLEALEIAIRKGIIIVNVSQCTGGRVIMGKYQTSQKMKEIGVVSGADMTLEAAISKLMWVLGNEITNPKELLEKELVGEMTNY